VFWLKSAEFTNFRLLQNVSVSFSSDPDKSLTVIRAANECGKTTMLRALTWGFFGDDALPGRNPRTEFRLSPLDWDVAKQGNEVGIAVELTFEIQGVEYVVIRSRTEKITGTGKETIFTVTASEVQLLEKTEGGHEPSSNPEALLRSLVPTALKDIFFMDGDRALVWIEAPDSRASKRQRVEKAVRSLLGLELIEAADKHVDGARLDAARKIRASSGSGSSVETLGKRVEGLTNTRDSKEIERVGLVEDRDAVVARVGKAEAAVNELLASGGADRQRLEADLKTQRTNIITERKRAQSLTTQHRKLLELPAVGYSLAQNALTKSHDLLGDLEVKKVIPDTLPDVIEDRLHKGVCICGDDLGPGTPKRLGLEEILAESRDQDVSHDLLAKLNNSVQLVVRDRATAWVDDLKESHGLIRQSIKDAGRAEEAVRELEVKIGEIPDQDLQSLNDNLKTQRDGLNVVSRKLGTAEAELSSAKSSLTEAKADWDKATKGQDKFREHLASQQAAEDIQKVLAETLDALKDEKLIEVSDRMSEIFVEMIRSDQEHAAIQGAVLTADHDIEVFGYNNQPLQPDLDLNGASRRALTLAFIHALTEVSGVEAPMIIDTPLGMMSGAVRWATFRYAAKSSDQLIAFLTRDEIHGVEDLIDEYAGHSFTMSATHHYPKDLVYKPDSDLRETVVCDCGHSDSCNVCERHPASAGAR
jgi:DNA sulfur modification protein DndD